EAPAGTSTACLKCCIKARPACGCAACACLRRTAASRRRLAFSAWVSTWSINLDGPDSSRCKVGGATWADGSHDPLRPALQVGAVCRDQGLGRDSSLEVFMAPGILDLSRPAATARRVFRRLR